MHSSIRKSLWPLSLAAVAALGCSRGEDLGAAASAAESSEALVEREALDLNAPGDNLKAYVKTRGSLNPNEEVVFYWSGTIYSFVKEEGLPTQKTNKVLFKFEGYNVARFVPVADGYQMLSREAAFYEDPATGQILECWANPLNGKTVPVVHVWNDPVNFALAASTWRPVPFTSLGPTGFADENLGMSSDVFLAYPSPLPVASYPEYSAGNLYQGAEMFNFYVKRSDLEYRPNTVPALISWTRVGQYLPWMQMGQEPGFVVYQTRGMKLRNGYADLPEKLRSYVESREPEYVHAPTEWPAGQTNMTSWKYFKSLVASGEYSPTCP